MKAIQSFWILQNIINSHAGGWINKRYEFIAWSLSYILLKKNFSRVDLRCNLAGAEMLIDTLGLSYDNVNIDLENETEMLQNSWVFGKIQTYAQQNEAFIHVDGDVFWFQPPTKDILSADVIAQNLELDDPMYRRLWSNCQKHASNLPEYMNTLQAKLGIASNAGILGGNNNEIFRNFFADSIKFSETNIETFKKYTEEFDYISTYIEQALFVCFTNFHNIKIAFLKKPTFRLNFQEVTNFNDIDSLINSPTYIHLLATFKYRIHYCNLMEFWLHRIWSEQLQKINNLCKENKSLAENFKILLDPSNEKKLPHKNTLFFSPKQVIAKPFFRTNQLLSTEINNLSENEIMLLIKKSTDNQRLSDCYNFEKTRISILYYCQRESTPEKLFAHFEQHLDFCSKVVEKRMNDLIVLNTNKVLRSKFNWYNDLRYNSNYYYYNIIISSDGICFQEMLLAELECQLLDLIEEKQSVRNLVTEWCSEYKIDENSKSIKLVDDAIKDLFSNNLIKIQ